MADRRTKKTAKQIFGYARLNFHMGCVREKIWLFYCAWAAFCFIISVAFVGIWHRQKKRSVCRSYSWL